jgi:hypothetical protein
MSGNLDSSLKSIQDIIDGEVRALTTPYRADQAERLATMSAASVHLRLIRAGFVTADLGAIADHYAVSVRQGVETLLGQREFSNLLARMVENDVRAYMERK